LELPVISGVCWASAGKAIVTQSITESIDLNRNIG